MIDGAERKARGAYFTPPEVATFLARWAVRSPSDRVLEPSAGDGAIASSLLSRLDALGAAHDGAPVLTCVELDSPTVATLRQRLGTFTTPWKVLHGDFFDVAILEKFDTAVGNPPFVRYQDFSGRSRTAARRAALAQGVRLNELASSWAAFTVVAAGSLKAGGRLGLVLPAEMLTVGYAAPVRQFLLDRFERVAVVLFEQRIFPEVQAEVVLLLAEGAGATDYLHVVQLGDASELDGLSEDAWRTTVSPRDGRWLSGLLTDEVERAYRHVVARDCFTTVSRWGKPQLGAVTGANAFFAVSRADRTRYGLTDGDVVDISPPGSRHLRQLSFSRRRWEQVGDAGSAVHLLKPAGLPSPGALAYIRHGVDQGLDQRYKCRVRQPWWDVPLGRVPHLFVTYMSAGSPQLIANRAGVHNLSSVHGIVLARGLQSKGMDLLPLASVSTISRLGAELAGRSYGGGVLKVEPSEAASLPTVAPDLSEHAVAGLRRVRRRVAAALGRGDLRTATGLVDRAMVDARLLEPAELEQLATGLRMLGGRRRARARS